MIKIGLDIGSTTVKAVALDEKGNVVVDYKYDDATEFNKYGFAGVIENWIINNMKENPQNIINKLNIMISGSFENAIKKMST